MTASGGGSSSNSVCMACPGSHPEMRQAGAGLHQAGQLHSYFTTIDPASNPAIRVGSRIPGNVGNYVRREARRRKLGLLEEPSVAVAGGLDLAAAAAYRVMGKSALHRRLTRMRNVRFDRAVAKRLPTEVRGLLAQAGACEATMGEARNLGLRTAVNWNIQHWDMSEREWCHESEHNPAWAPLFTHTRLPRELIEQWERELELTDLILVPSRSVEESFLSAGYEARRLHIVPYGVDAGRFSLPIAPRRPARERLTLIMVGEIGQRKGMSYLIETALRMPQHQFLAVGWKVGPIPGSMPDNVAIHHDVPDVVPFLHQADVFLFPSLLDGFGLVVLQAMATGLPAIVSSNAGAVDVIDEGVDGFVVAPRDVDAMVNRIESLASSSQHLLADMSDAAHRKAQQYPWRRFHHGIVQMFL